MNKKRIGFKEFRKKYVFKEGFWGWIIAFYWWNKLLV